MLKHLAVILFGFFCLPALSQAGWNWPEDPEKEKLAKEKQAYYRLQMVSEKETEGAWSTLQWLYKNAPDLNESIYIDGSKLLDDFLSTDIGAERRKNLEDSMLWTFDMRMKYFEDAANVKDRKAYAAFKMYYQQPAKFPLLLELYDDLYSQDSRTISEFNLTPYMTLAANFHKEDPESMPVDKVLEIHSTITSVIDEKKANGGDPEKLQKEQDKVDAFLSSLGDTLSCEFIEMQLVPKFMENPEDVNLAKKIFSYSLKAKCTDKEYFMMAGQTFYKSKPSFSLAMALGDKFYTGGNPSQALEYYSEAEEMASSGEEKIRTQLGKASAFSKMGNKREARSMALEVLKVNPDSKEPYNLIGNLYFTSFDDCKGGESKVEDRAVFIAAYQMYVKAGNAEQMTASKAQFPSVEEIFNEGYEEGQSITVNCWINESVKLMRRP